MNLVSVLVTHPRLWPAHGPEPLTTPGAAQACPTCLPSPSHQLTGIGDLRPHCPLQKGPRFAPRQSAIGNITGKRPAFSRLPMPASAGQPLICGVRDVWPSVRPLALAALAYPANQLTCDSDLRHNRPLIKGVRFAPGHSSIGGNIQSDSRTSSLPPWRSLSLPAVSPFAFNLVNASRHSASPDLINPIRRSHVIQDSDFRWKSRGRKNPGFSSVPPDVRRPSERLAPAHQLHPSK